MGIQNLLLTLKSISTQKHLESYRNKRVAIDGYCWLHKSIYTLEEKDILSPKPNLSNCMHYLKNRLYPLLKYQIVPIVVFDGAKLPMKLVEESREKTRNKLNEEAKALLLRNDNNSAKYKKLQAFDISPEMAYEFIKILKEFNIEFFVAPYEADLQLAYLSKINYVDFVITEDSDLLALGCKCVLYKLDRNNNIGEEYKYENIKLCKEYDFSMFNEDQFLHFCMLCGCDYFKMKSVGIKNAYYAIKNNNGYKNALYWLCNKNKGVSFAYKELEEKFEKAFLTFRYQVIYCPIAKKMRYFGDIVKSNYPFLDKYKSDLSFLGTIIEDPLAKEIVFGIVDPITKKRFIDKVDPFIASINEWKKKSEEKELIEKEKEEKKKKGNRARTKPKKVKSKSRFQTSIDNFCLKTKEDIKDKKKKTFSKENKVNNCLKKEDNTSKPSVNLNTFNYKVNNVKKDYEEIKSSIELDTSLASLNTDLTTQHHKDNNDAKEDIKKKPKSKGINIHFKKRKFNEINIISQNNPCSVSSIIAKYSDVHINDSISKLIEQYSFTPDKPDKPFAEKRDEESKEEDESLYKSPLKYSSSIKTPKSSQSIIDFSEYCFNPFEEVKKYAI